MSSDQPQSARASSTAVEAKLMGPAARGQIVSHDWHETTTHTIEPGERHRLALSLSFEPRKVFATFPGRWSPHRYARVGAMILLPAGETARIRIDDVAPMTREHTVVCHIDEALLSEGFGGAVSWTDLQLERCLDISDHGLRATMTRLAGELVHRAAGCEKMIDSLCALLAIELGRFCARGARARAPGGGLAARRLRLIDDRIRACGKAPTLAELAELCNISVRQLSRGFQMSRGCSVGEHIEQTRLEQARRLLYLGNTIKEVSHKLGYASPSSFTAAFRRAMGTSPSQFRLIA